MSKIISLLFCFLITESLLAQCERSAQILWGTNNGQSVFANDATYNSQKDLVVCGYTGTDGLLVQYNNDSSVRWSKIYRTGLPVSFQKVISFQNGDLGIAGYSTEASGDTAILVVRTTATGNIIWSKRFFDVSSVSGLINQSLQIRSIAETPDGGIVICCRKVYKRTGGGNNYRIAIFKINNSGILNWSKEQTQGTDDEPTSMLIDQGSIVIAGSTYSQATGVRFGFLEKLNPANGSLDLIKRYQLNNTESNYIRSIEKVTGGYEMGAQSFEPGRRIYLKLKVDTNGDNISNVSLPEFGPDLADQFYHPVPLADGSSILWTEDYYSSPDIVLTKLKGSTVEWNNQFTQPGQQSIKKLLLTENNGALALGNSPHPSFPPGVSCIYSIRITSTGNTDGCILNPLPFSGNDTMPYVITNTITWQTSSLNFQVPTDQSLTVNDITLNKIKLCEKNSCEIKSVKIAGDTLICQPNALVRYKAVIDGSCRVPTVWSLSAPIGLVQLVNDSIIQIQFTQAGKATLQAIPQNTCIPIDTSITITYLPGTTNILGNDTGFCSKDSITLRVSNQFTSVLWNDGSTANALNIKNPGTYNVTVSKDGLCYLKDTIIISEYPLPKINLPDNETVCIPNGITLDAGNNFTSYVWQDGSTKSTLMVKTPGVYWVTVTDKNGCKASDTTIITKTSGNPTGFTLIKDTSICYGEKLLLQLNQPFRSYNWNNGQSNASSFEITQAGTYIIEVITNDGCYGYDSTVVRDKGCTKKVYLPTAFTPDKNGRNDTYKAYSTAPLEIFELSIFNRWGEKVFHTKDINKGWDGLYKGIHQPMGIYMVTAVYRYSGSNKNDQQKTSMLLIK